MLPLLGPALSMVGSAIPTVAGMFKEGSSARNWINNKLGDTASGMSKLGPTLGLFDSIRSGNEMQERNNRYQDLNYQNMLDVQAYNKDVQQTTWNREDTAVQRRVADLKAAGLSPILAAGSAASSSAPINVTTPQHGAYSNEQAINTANFAISMMQQQADISRTLAQTAYTDAQKNYLKTYKTLETDTKISKSLAETEAINFKNIGQQLNNMLLKRDVDFYGSMDKNTATQALGILGQILINSMPKRR